MAATASAVQGSGTTRLAWACKRVNTVPKTSERLLSDAVTHQQAGRRTEAGALYRAILRVEPRHPAANHNLGVLALTDDRIDEALHHLKQAVEADPAASEAWVGYIEALLRAGRSGSARDVLRLARQRGLDGPPFMLFEGRLAALTSVPPIGATRFAEPGRVRFSPASPNAALTAQVEALINTQRHAEAQPLAVRLVQLEPQRATGWTFLGAALRGLGQNLPALRPLARAIELDGGDALARHELGLALSAAGRYGEAEASLLAAHQIEPGNANVLHSLGLLAMDTHRIAEAETRLREALKLAPKAAGLHNSLGALFERIGRLAEANACFRAALQIAPDFPNAVNNLAMNLLRIGEFDEAEQLFRRLLDDRPDFLVAHSNLLLALSYSARHSVQDGLTQARRYGELVAARAPRPFTAWAAQRSSGKLRVGVVSGDIEEHPVGFFLEGLLSQLDPRRLELLAYPTQSSADELTARLRPRFAEWRPLVGLNDEAAARLIHSDGVDVLIDLSGHTAHNRLPVFAFKPAPVQVTWLGYFATTGVAAIDYLLADAVSVPPEHQDHFTEKIWYLPDTRLCFTPPRDAPDVTPLPALANGFVTFGSFQHLAKLNDDVLALWGQVMAALPRSRLRVQSKRLVDAGVRELLLKRLQQAGVAAERVTLHGPVLRREFQAAHAEVDLVLDSFPFPGGTTTCEALWMGVPTLTLAGDRLISRQGASLLTAAGLPSWIAHTPVQFVDKAVAFASDIPALATLRARLRAQVLDSPLFDAARFARHFETALWAMWQRSQSGVR